MARMVLLGLPSEEKILSAIGKIAIRHGQLDYVLRMTIKTLSDVTIVEALDATDRQGSQELRKRILTLARKRLGEGPPLIRLQALLKRCRTATDHRNELLHGLWTQELDGADMFGHPGVGFSEIPPAEKLEAVAEEMHLVFNALNEARLDGFLSEALAEK